MFREPLEDLLAGVTDAELEHLRDAILREEGRRRTQYRLVVPAPYPPLAASLENWDAVVNRWARLLGWLAKDAGIPPAETRRGVSIALAFAGDVAPEDPQTAGILLQEALVEAGFLLGRTPETMDATSTQAVPDEADAVIIEMWDK